MGRYLAFDLGAESGRAVLGTLRGGMLELEEVHRFANVPVRLRGGLYWNALGLFQEMLAALRLAASRGVPLDGIAVDTWGVDYGLLAADGTLLENPRCYRDARTQGQLDSLCARVPQERIFGETGIQFMELNTLVQLWAARGTETMRVAHRLLFLPDLFAYWLGGRMANELTIASTSQCLRPADRQWATPLLQQLDIPTHVFGELVEPGARLGSLSAEVQDATGLQDVPLFATAGHDTASAVAAMPAEGDGTCYISSGTWSLMGVESAHPVINEASRQLNFTNELGAGGRVRLLKNIMGLWLLQECRREWQRQAQDLSYEQLVALAEEAVPNLAVVDPDAFFAPGRMPQRIQDACRASGQGVPQTPGQIARVILESLAHTYKRTLDNLERLTGQPIHTIHILGGGSRNRLLNRLAEEVTGRRVVAGPTEATAMGNILVQAIGAGELRDLDEARAVVRRSLAGAADAAGQR